MAQTIYGAQLFKSPGNPTNTDGGRIAGKNSEAFTANDVVTTNSRQTGLKVAGATAPIYGVVLKTVTMASNNLSLAAPVAPSCFIAETNTEWLMGTNADLGTLTSLGQYYKLTGTTGVQQVDVASGTTATTSRIVLCTEVDPNQLGGSGAGSGLRQGLFKFVDVVDFQQG